VASYRRAARAAPAAAIIGNCSSLVVARAGRIDWFNGKPYCRIRQAREGLFRSGFQRGRSSWRPIDERASARLSRTSSRAWLSCSSAAPRGYASRLLVSPGSMKRRAPLDMTEPALSRQFPTLVCCLHFFRLAAQKRGPREKIVGRPDAMASDRSAVNWIVIDQCTRWADSYLCGGATF